MDIIESVDTCKHRVYYVNLLAYSLPCLTMPAFHSIMNIPTLAGGWDIQFVSTHSMLPHPSTLAEFPTSPEHPRCAL